VVWRKLPNEGPNLYSTPGIMRVIKRKRIDSGVAQSV
jgi:hypothetical protein